MTRDCDPNDRTFAYDPVTGAYHTTFDGTDAEALVTTVVRAVATLAGVRAIDIEPAYYQVDLDALYSLIAAPGRLQRTRECGTWFTLSGYTIVVYGGGDIAIYPPAGELRVADGGTDTRDRSREAREHPERTGRELIELRTVDPGEHQ